MLVTKEKASISGDLAFSKRVEMTFDPNARNMQVRNAIRMYANPRLAALREYTSNAKDAHQAANYKGPVEVTLPTALHPFLTIVDHGVGLDSKELEGFGQFGHTTKDGSNDYIGGFGLGSKSGLAVADQFTVISVKGGKKNVVVVGWDESGAPSLGFLDEQTTNEPNGTTIQIPSATGHGDWENIASGKTFLGWAPGTILINGKNQAKSVHDTNQYRPINGGWLSVMERENSSRYYYGSDYIDALVHGVYYRIPADKFRDRTVLRVLDGSVLNLPNGSVDILPSRDDLEWTDATLRSVRDAADVMVKAVVAEYEKEIKAAKTFIEAKKIADRMDALGLPIKNLSFKGILLDWTRETQVEVTYGKVKHSTSAKTGWQTDRVATTTRAASEVHKAHSILVLNCSGETKSGYLKKDMRFLDESGHTVPFAVAVADKAGIDVEKVRVYYAKGDKSTLPAGFVLAFQQVIEADAFAEVVKEQRKVWAKDRAANTAAGTRPKPVDRMLRCVTGYNNWASSFSVGERSEQGIIANGNPVVVLHHGDPLAKVVLEGHTNNAVSNRVGSLMKFIAQQMTATNTTFVLMAKNHKTENLAIQGWVNLSDWLRSALATQPLYTPMELAAQKYRRERPHYNMIPKVDAATVSLINNTTMREWMQAYIAPDTTNTPLGEVVSAYSEYAPTQPEAADFKPWERYPLAAHISLGRDEYTLFSDYVNLVDATRKGK